MRKRIMHWLWDGRPEWKPEWFITAASWLLCRLFGHTPIADQCSKPEHDFCAWCSGSMPFAAPRRVPTTEES